MVTSPANEAEESAFKVNTSEKVTVPPEEPRAPAASATQGVHAGPPAYLRPPRTVADLQESGGEDGGADVAPGGGASEGGQGPRE